MRKLSQKYESLRIERPQDNDVSEEGHHESQKMLTVIRSLTDNEIATLFGACACRCEDWSKVFIMYYDTAVIKRASYGEDLSTELQNQVSRCTFKGNVVIGIVTELDLQNCVSSTSQSGDMMHGLHSNALVMDSIIEPHAAVYNNTMISNTFIGSSATVTNCGVISSSSVYPFEDSMEINIGPEAGGDRKVKVTPESTLVDICASMRLSHFGKLCRTSAEAKPLLMNIINGKLHYTSTVSNLYLAPSAIIESCPSISNCILLPHASIRNSTATASYLQWKSSISDSSTVSNAIIMECAAIGPHSVVASTVLGPDSHVSCGEVHCSLIGPNTNSHHQSLLISALWPMGRGNVGYGSNIGSNHTGRIPDQECTVGEGIFWGLGCVIKFPVDLSRAFYSVVAAGVHLPPQRVSMPFCLIMEGGSSSGSINEERNELVPGWILKSSPYTIVRSEEKFKNRRKAKRHDFYCGWKIIRPSIVDSCVKARDLLRNVAKKRDQAEVSKTDEKCADQVYTEALLPQLGSNYMTERGRKVGIDAYTNLIQRYILKGLLEQMVSLQTSDQIKSRYELKNRLEALLKKPLNINSTSVVSHDKASWPLMPWDEELNGSKLWDHQRSILLLELPSIVAGDEVSIIVIIKLLLKKLKSLEQSHAAQVYKSKHRDDIRGTRIIPDYRVAHTMAEDDSVVRLTNARMKDTIKQITEMLGFCDELELGHQNRSLL